MDLNFSGDQRMLKDSIDGLIADHYTFEKRTKYLASQNGWSPEVWKLCGELGLLMLPFGEAEGGLGLGGIETMIVGEAFGRGLVLEPYLPSVVLAGSAIKFGGSEAQRAELLPGIMSGETFAAFADKGIIDAQPDNGGWRLNGRVSLVLGGDVAHTFIVRGPNNLFVIASNVQGLSQRSYRLHGGGGAADLVLDNVKVEAAAVLNDASDRAIEAGIAFLAAEATGALQAALDVTVDYIKNRVQFGKPIGANQALQHRAAEMLVEVEQARSAAMYAAVLNDETEALERAKGMSAVKAVIGKAARFVGQQSIQLHGGMGVSEEYVVGHYFKRLNAIEMLLGDSEAHIAKLASLGGFTDTAI